MSIPPDSKSNKGATCFVSYCHADADRASLQYAIEAIQEHSSQTITFHYDQLLPYGQSFDSFMHLINQSDMVLVVLTPQYKERVGNRTGGVYKEFGYIVQKSEESTKLPLKEEGIRIGVMPILFSGSLTTAVPEPLSHLKYVDLTGLVVREEGGKLSVPDSIRERYKGEFKRIADQVIVKSTLRAATYLPAQAEYYDRLFLKLKHPRGSLEEAPGYKDVLVETHAYDTVNQQRAYFIVGRKGSGKSTITTMLGMLNPGKYKTTIGIRADNVNLQHASAALMSLAKVDNEGVLTPLKYFDFGWQGFFVLALIEKLVCLYKTDQLSAEQARHMGPLLSFWVKLEFGGADTDTMQQALLVYAVEHVHEFLTAKINNAPNTMSTGAFLATIVAGFNLNEFLEALIGTDATISLGQIVSHCQKQVLVTLDDFDTAFDSFRRRPVSDEERVRASQIELEWIRSLLLLVVDIKNQQTSAHPYFRVFDFCLTIPQDRFSEIERHDRDGYLYNTAAANIQWSGRELCELLVRRLEKLSDYQCKPGHPKDRLSEILGAQWPGIPQTIAFRFNGYPVSMPLFLYVLRHTFWRPRDVLLYFGNILAAAMNIRAGGDKISSEVIRRIVSETTYQIIKTEFLDEYGSVFQNLREAINGFARKPQIGPFKEFEESLRRVPFKVLLPDKADFDVHEKLELLFDIGFIGIQMDARLRNTLNIEIDHAFYFNEGRSALRAVRKGHYIGTSFIIHPIFTENLILDTSENAFILQLTWDYIDNNHAVMVAGGRHW